MMSSLFQMPARQQPCVHVNGPGTREMQISNSIQDLATETPRRGIIVWWTQELRGLLPDRSQKYARPKRRLVAALSLSGVRWLDETDQSLKVIGPDTGDVQLPPDTLKAVQRLASRRRPVPLGLRLERSACFERRLEVPAAARADFSRILELDLERATPFKHREVYTAFCEDMSATASKGKTVLRQFIVKRPLIDAPRQKLETLGLQVAFADCWDDNGLKPLPLDFLASPHHAGAAEPPPRLLAKLLVFCLLALAASAAWLSIQRGNSALAELETKVTEAKTRAQSLRKTVGNAEAAFKGAAALQNLKSGVIPAAEILEELSRRLPDTTYISDFRIERGKISITGFAQSAAALVPLVEQSALFEAATSPAPVLFDPYTGKEQFRIEARIAGQNNDVPTVPVP